MYLSLLNLRESRVFNLIKSEVRVLMRILERFSVSRGFLEVFQRFLVDIFLIFSRSQNLLDEFLFRPIEVLTHGGVRALFSACHRDTFRNCNEIFLPHLRGFPGPCGFIFHRTTENCLQRSCIKTVSIW